MDRVNTLTRTWISQLPRLGVGIGFRRRLARDIFANADRIDFLEIISEHFLNPTGDEDRQLQRLREQFPLIPHGLDLSPATAEPAPPGYLNSVAGLVERTGAPWWSDHLAMTRAGGIEIGHLAPLAFTAEALEVVCANIAAARRAVPAPLIIENIAYTLRLPNAEMSEAEFITRVLEETDCGLLLDLMNLHANAVNHGFDPYEFLERIPLGRCVQVHIIGGHTHRGVVVDSHSTRTPPEVWRLLEFVAARADLKGVLIEWDERFPHFHVLIEEMERAREILYAGEVVRGAA